MKKQMDRKKAQIFEGWLSIIVNALLFVAKFWVGLVTGSVALMADAWHTMSDSLTSIIVVFSARLASKKPDKEHPFGHGRWELICTIIIGCILAFIGFEFLSDSIDRFRNRETVTYGTLALVVTIVSIIIKELLAQIAFYIGRKTNNPIVSADGWHHRTDSLSSVVVLAGIIVTRFVGDLWWMDSVLGIFCALAIFYAAFEILKDAITRMLGEEPSPELIEQITKWKVGDRPVQFMATGTPINNYFTIENFPWHEDGGDIGTLHYTLVLKEYRETSARQVTIENDVATIPEPAPTRVDNRVPEQTHEVVRGDNLSAIARAKLGDASRWPEIFELNRDIISNPNLIFPGQVLRLPPA